MKSNVYGIYILYSICVSGSQISRDSKSIVDQCCGYIDEVIHEVSIVSNFGIKVPLKSL